MVKVALPQKVFVSYIKHAIRAQRDSLLFLLVSRCWVTDSRLLLVLGHWSVLLCRAHAPARRKVIVTGSAL